MFKGWRAGSKSRWVDLFQGLVWSWLARESWQVNALKFHHDTYSLSHKYIANINTSHKTSHEISFLHNLPCVVVWNTRRNSMTLRGTHRREHRDDTDRLSSDELFLFATNVVSLLHIYLDALPVCVPLHYCSKLKKHLTILENRFHFACPTHMHVYNLLTV